MENLAYNDLAESLKDYLALNGEYEFSTFLNEKKQALMPTTDKKNIESIQNASKEFEAEVQAFDFDKEILLSINSDPHVTLDRILFTIQGALKKFLKAREVKIIEQIDQNSAIQRKTIIFALLPPEERTAKELRTYNDIATENIEQYRKAILDPKRLDQITKEFAKIDSQNTISKKQQVAITESTTKQMAREFYVRIFKKREALISISAKKAN